MPYRPFRSQNRVEYIKKKFENSFSEENKSTSLKTPNDTVPYKSKVLLELKGLTSDRNNSKEKCHKIKCEKVDGKAHVKRTPAFRREKLGCVKTLGDKVSCQGSVGGLSKSEENISKQMSKEENNTCQIKIAEEILAENTLPCVQRSKTDSKIFRNCDSKNKDNVNSIRSTLICKSINLLGQSPNNVINNNVRNSDGNPQTDTTDEVLVQYSLVNKNLKKKINEELDELQLSESIRRALQSPLPKGPPPKKPPRTFCHIPQSPNKSKSVILKTDLPKLKSKLEKLEKVVKIHEIGSNNMGSMENIKSDIEKVLKKVPKAVESKSLPNISHKKNESQSCLQFSNCLNQSTNTHIYEKLLKKKSKFYLNMEKFKSESQQSSVSDNKITSTNGMELERVVSESNTSEPVYDLPCINKKSHLRTFGRSDKENFSDLKIVKPEEGLHYMSADIVNQIRFPSNMDHAEYEELDQSGPPSGLTVKERINRFDGDNEQEVFKMMSKLKIVKEVEQNKDEKEKMDFRPPFRGPQEIPDHPSSFCLLRTADSEEFSVKKIGSSKAIGIGKISNGVPYWKNINKSSYMHLFECCLLVGLTLCEPREIVPYIKSVFPPAVKPPPLIEALCFPDASDWPPSLENQRPEEQYYSLVVTNENGDRKFGYCRRVLPEGAHFCLPLTYCIISPHRANGFFYKVLGELESRHGSPGLEDFIKQLYECEFPGPGERLKLKNILEEATRAAVPDLPSTLMRRPPDMRLEEKDLTQLLQLLELRVLLKIFSSLLLERKILLLSESLRKLSSCIEALQSILLPFSWQHTYIPVLPVHLKEICEAPTPYVIGLLKPKTTGNSFPAVNFDHGILVDLDDSKVIKCCGDEDNILPPKFAKDLTTSLNLAANAAHMSETNRNVLISDSFIRFFLQICGNYYNYLQNSADGQKVFKKKEFIKSISSNATQSFLEKFTQTAMFTAFIDECISGHEEDVLIKFFILRAVEYSKKSRKI